MLHCLWGLSTVLRLLHNSPNPFLLRDLNLDWGLDRPGRYSTKLSSSSGSRSGISSEESQVGKWYDLQMSSSSRISSRSRSLRRTWSHTVGGGIKTRSWNRGRTWSRTRCGIPTSSSRFNPGTVEDKSTSRRQLEWNGWADNYYFNLVQIGSDIQLKFLNRCRIWRRIEQCNKRCRIQS